MNKLNSFSPPHRFTVQNLDDAIQWQNDTRPLLGKVIGFQTIPPVSPSPEKIEAVDRGEYTREKYLIWTTEHSCMPFYLLLPKHRLIPTPVMIAFHGHGYGVKDVVGLWEDGQERFSPSGYHKDFAVELCLKGFAVAAPEISCFGERQTDFSYLNTTIGSPVPSTCHHTAMLAFHLGGSVVGLRVLDSIRLIDYLESRSDLDTKHIGAMGISGGGMHTFFSTCLDTRIKACVISGYYGTFKDSILAMDHCPCNFVPGLAKFGEMYDLVGLIAPRPLLIESGSYDTIFPVKAVRSSYEIAKQVYQVFGKPENLEADFFEGRHEIHGERAYPFLTSKLMPG